MRDINIHKMKRHLRFVYGILSVLILELVTCPAMGQGLIKRDITSEDYKLWSKLYSDKISDDGNWISYELRYESHHDTLFVKNTITNKTFGFPKCSKSKFGAEKVFVCKDSNKNLKVMDLVKETLFLIENVISYEFSNDGQFIISLETTNNKQSNLCIRYIDGKLVRRIENVTEYKLNKLGNKVIYVSSNEQTSNIGQIAFTSKVSVVEVLSNLPPKIQNLTWAKDESTIAFYGLNKTWELFMYQMENKKIFNIKDLPVSYFGSSQIAVGNNISLEISEDNTAVFFYYKSAKEKVLDKPIVEIWNANDKSLYVDRELAQTYNKPFLGVWYPQMQISKPVSDKKYQWVTLTGDQKFAIVADPLRYEPQFLLFVDVDYYIVDVKNGSRELLVEKVSSHPSNIQASPNGKFVNYYKNHGWWIYDIEKKTHTNITAGLATAFDNRFEDPNPELYGCAGWTSDGKSILINDRFDVWKISTDGKNKSRLTYGKEKKICFRMVNTDSDNIPSANYSGISSSIYNLDKINVLSAESNVNADSGYFTFDQKKIKPLVFKDRKISRLLKAKNKDTYVFTEQSFMDSPSIVLKSSLQDQDKTVVKTNTQQKHFYWGTTEMIHYYSSKNKPLNGALFYPAHYNASVKYPMVVFIYSSPSGAINDYVNPTDHNGIGFNITTMTASGYFVLFADIAYEKGNPGISAVECVSSAVKKVVERNLVDPAKVGLLAQSFGGYEANFIITQTNLFAAAVSGSAVSDIIRSYFSISADYSNPEIWRYESQQYRMVDSFYENKYAYLRNSPILQAEKIKTPLLTWAGKNDGNVKPEQSTALYIAMRRLNKTHVMLQYPNQGHILTAALAQEDLSKKTMEWFDHYLKNNAPASWIMNRE